MQVPDMPIQYTYIHQPCCPNNVPYGWGIAYKHFSTNYHNLPGQKDVNDLPSNVEFWNTEIQRLESELNAAIKDKNTNKMEKIFDMLSVAKTRLSKESQ